jgi:hypothetical protein
MEGGCAMQSYRLMFLDKHGRLIANKSIDCMEDGEAIAAVEQEFTKPKLANCDHVEIWNRGRPVCVCANPNTPPAGRRS